MPLDPLLSPAELRAEPQGPHSPVIGAYIQLLASERLIID